MLRLNYPLRKELKISNVICTADLKQSVDIASFNNYKFLYSNLDLYRCGYIKNDEMIGRVTVFGNGKLISAGTKSPENAILELKRALKILQKNKLIKSFKIFPKIQNIAATGIIGEKINIQHLAKTLPLCIYEPDQFPGLIYPIQGSVVALIFASGKIVLVGTKTINELNSVFFELRQRIIGFS